MATESLYLGFDLSTQQLKGVVVDSTLKVIYNEKFDFDADARGFDIEKGVMTNKAEHEVFAPVALWLQALDSVLLRLKDAGLDFGRVSGISGACQQHGSVYWSADATSRLSSLDSVETLEAQLDDAFSHPYSPNWQDASTQRECDDFDKHLGSPEALARVTGSKAHHILRFQRKYPDEYKNTSRISLVSSFLASVFLGKIAPFDISDVCGMNLWDIRRGCWHEGLLKLAAGPYGSSDLAHKLGDVPEDGGLNLGCVSGYFIKRFGFNPRCTIVPSTGDNPATILALPLRSLDAMVSLGTSTTFLMSTPEYQPDPATHFFNSPTTAGLYMFMLCYKNGGLAREKVRDLANLKVGCKTHNSWDIFDDLLRTIPPLAQHRKEESMKMGLYFPRPEIVPNLPDGQWHYTYEPLNRLLAESEQGWQRPNDDVRAIVESQFLSLRLRSKELVRSPDGRLPPQPRRIYLVGGGSKNRDIAKVAGEVLGGSEGIYKLDVGENACALGAAYKAVWAIERIGDQTFEDLIGSRWREEQFAQKIANGYQEGIFEKYGEALIGFERMENELLRRYGREG
ncbi:MAG: hypothetical protein Q9160_007367 [Pyrenula sp. 1 TL-2023]